MVDITFETKPGIVDDQQEEKKIIPSSILKKGEEANKDENGKILLRDQKVVSHGIANARSLISREMNKSKNITGLETQTSKVGKLTMARRAVPALFGSIFSFAQGAFRFVKGYVPEAVGAKTKTAPLPPSSVNTPQIK